MILDRNKTVDKILNSTFPTGLLNALTALDNALLKLEKSNPDHDEDVEADPELVSELVGGAVVAAMAFRSEWAVYEDEEPEPERFFEAKDIEEYSMVSEEEMEKSLAEMDHAADRERAEEKKKREAEEEAERDA